MEIKMLDKFVQLNFFKHCSWKYCCTKEIYQKLILACSVKMCLSISWWIHLFSRVKKVIGGSCRVTLVVAFWFLPQHFGRWHRSMNGILPLYECRLSGADTQTLPAIIGNIALFALTGSGNAKTSLLHPHTVSDPSTRATWWNFYYLIFGIYAYCWCAVRRHWRVLNTHRTFIHTNRSDVVTKAEWKCQN